MICAHCGRTITKPAATVRKVWSGFDEHFGPVCAAKLKLTKPTEKAKKAKMTRIRNKANSQAFWDAQDDLFASMPSAEVKGDTT